MASARLFQHETRGHARPVTTSSTAAIFSHVREGNWFEGNIPLLARSQVQQVFATCNERDPDAGRELSKAPAPPPPSPRRHCKILLDIVTRILYATSSSKIVFHASTVASVRHRAILSLQRSCIMTLSPNDVVAGRAASQPRARDEPEWADFHCYFIVINNSDRLRPASARLEHGTWPTVVDRGSEPARASQHGATAISSGKLSTHS